MSMYYGGPSCFTCGLKLNECSCTEDQFCGKKECNHSWIYDSILLTSMPPKQRRICKLCGLKETVAHGDTNDELSYGDVDVIFNTFNEK